MKNNNNSIGHMGEAIAVKHILAKGYAIIDRNYSTPFGEIDIIARRGEYLVFVEVKTRTTDEFDSPLFAITPYKKNCMIKNAFYYIKRKGLIDPVCRIDVIAIKLDLDGKLETLEHIENAVEIE